MQGLTIIISLFLAIAVILLPQRYFLLPYIVAACFVPADQRVIIMTLDFTVLRILVVSGMLRLSLRNEFCRIEWNNFDKLVFGWAVCGAIVYVLLWLDMRALIYKCGILFDIIGLYCLFRVNIRSWSDIRTIAIISALCSIALVILVAREWATGKNPFMVLGRVTTAVREGNYRCQAAFPHSIMLGLFWATLIPLFYGFVRQYGLRTLFCIAIGASVFIIAATMSSTPLVALIVVIIVILCYKWRQFTGYVAGGLLVLLVALHLAMQAPVWHLISRISLIGGSTGWHRFNLIDKAILHFGEWALLGCQSTAHWGWGLTDLTNQYVLEGVRGGLVTLVLFLVMIFCGLKILLHYSLCLDEPKKRLLAWSLFAMMIGHCISFLGVSYFGQIDLLWYLTLAMIGFVAETKLPQVKITCQVF